MSATEPVDASQESIPQPYTRKATGLVREIPLLDAVAFNSASGGGGLGFAVALTLFIALIEFPGANLVLALVIGLLLCIPIWITWSLLGAAMPRVGGDYLYNSRLLHPVLGLIGNVSQFVSVVLTGGLIAYFVPTAGLVPAFTIIGRVTNSHGWVSLADTLSSKGWTLAIGIAVVLVLSALSILGTRITLRVMTICVIVGTVGFIIALLVTLFESRSGFVTALNSFSRPFTHTANTYSATLAAGAKDGLIYPDRGSGYSSSATFGALITGVFFFAPFMWSVYMSGEMKGAGRRSRQMSAIIGTGVGQGIIVILAVIIFLHVVGYDFYTAATAGAYGVPVEPYYFFFSAIAASSSFIAIVVGLTFLFFFPPAVYINLAMSQRAPFAWAFDGLIPKKIAAVNDRTHTPVVAITIIAIGSSAAVVWATYGKTFLTLLSEITLLFFVPFVIVGISAVLMPRLRPHLYKDGPADWRVLGLPMLPITGAACTLISLFVMFLILHFHTSVGIAHVATALYWVLGCAVAAIVLYYGASAVQRRRGVDLSLVYKTIPPE